MINNTFISLIITESSSVNYILLSIKLVDKEKEDSGREKEAQKHENNLFNSSVPSDHINIYKK
jgi:hypothetical protein